MKSGLWGGLVLILAAEGSSLAGFSAAAGHALESSSIAQAHDPLSGRWHAQLPRGDEKEAELFLDLGRLDGRWIGECNFDAFGLSDFTLSVVVRDSMIHLDFGGTDASFDGRLTGAPPRIAGRNKARLVILLSPT